MSYGSEAFIRRGDNSIAWAAQNMPLLTDLERQLSGRAPLADKKIAVSVDLDAKAAWFCQALASAGAELHVAAAHPLTTRDDVCASLALSGITVYSRKGDSIEARRAALEQALSIEPDLIIDNDGELTDILHGDMAGAAQYMLGCCEQSSHGTQLIKALEDRRALSFPVISSHESRFLRDVVYAFSDGQTVLDAITRATNLAIAGKTVVVAGYESGQGIAERARCLNAHVVIAESRPEFAVEAALQGYRVMSMDDAARIGDIFISAMGSPGAISDRHISLMKECVLLVNAGHTCDEINMARLRAIALNANKIRPNVKAYRMAGGNIVCVLGEGQPIRGVSGEGQPIEIMDLHYVLQTLSLLYLNENGTRMGTLLYSVPLEIERYVAELKLSKMGIRFDKNR